MPRYFHDGQNGAISFPPFEQADIGRVKIAEVCKFFLCQTTFSGVRDKVDYASAFATPA